MTSEGANSSFLSLTPLSLDTLDAGGSLLQSGFWGAFKATAGWRPLAFSWEWVPDRTMTETGLDGEFLVLERRFTGGLRMAYVPYGPRFPQDVSIETLSAVLSEIARAVKAHLSPLCFVIRFDLTGGTHGPVNHLSDIGAPPQLRSPLKPAPYRVQPPDTVILPLEGDDESLMAGMHKKTRYNIKLAGRKGVTIRRLQGERAIEALPSWYALYRETAERDGIALHPESYYRRLFELAGEDDSQSRREPRISLYMADHETDLLAGIIVAQYGRQSTYMYGASGALKRELMPNHLLQWTAIRDARDENALIYDFFGVPPANDPTHPMHGLWRFKTGFGGELHHYLGAWDYAFRPMVYTAYRWAEKIRGHLAARRKRR